VLSLHDSKLNPTHSLGAAGWLQLSDLDLELDSARDASGRFDEESSESEPALYPDLALAAGLITPFLPEPVGAGNEPGDRDPCALCGSLPGLNANTASGTWAAAGPGPEARSDSRLSVRSLFRASGPSYGIP
jgi:hypothetical protein